MKENFQKLYDILIHYMDDEDIEEVNRAFLFASKAHESQIRKSGEPYIIHPIAVSIILAYQKSPKEVIISGLLHDVVEDTEYTYEDIEENFSKEIADIVEGVTKLGKIGNYNYDQMQAENHRKIIIAAAKDIRVLLIKLSDRLHNMRTIQFMNHEKQKLIANETLEVYAPIAHRLGMYEMKWELEDLSFKCLNPERYKEIAQMIEMKRSEREKIVEKTLEYIHEILDKKEINAVIKGRSKHIYSINKKLNQGKQFEDILDLFAFRIIVQNISECYVVLGIIHQYFKPIPFKFKDYIPTPKHNMYQSIHTTVLTKQGVPMEFQIRTEQMNAEAEFGIASHWMYKENKDFQDFQESVNQKLTWLRKILEEGDLDSNSQVFMNHVKGDYLSKSVFLFTPKGDIIELPEGSTVLDFAFYVHTSVGKHALSAKVNDKVVSLFYKLKMGEIVNIITSPHVEPSLTWLSRVKTTRAKETLKSHFKEVEHQKIQKIGQKIFYSLNKEFPNLDFKELVDSGKIYSTLEKLHITKLEVFFYELGIGQIQVDDLKKLIKKSKNEKEDEEIINNVIIKNDNSNYYTKMCKYCSPLPGDKIHATKVSSSLINQYYIHRESCFFSENKVEAEFTENAKKSLYICRIDIEFKDTKLILSKIINIISNYGYNITSIYGRGNLEDKGTCKISIEIHEKKNFKDLQKKLEQLDAVEHVVRSIN